MALPQMGTNSEALRKRVRFEGTTTIYEGMPVCYNYDTTDNILGYSGSAISGTTAEGGQNEGKFMRVELASSANAMFFAGVVAGKAWDGLTGPRWIEIYVANGAIVPVRTNANCTVGATTLGLSSAAAYLAAVNAGDDNPPVAIAMETVDRSSTNGVVLAKVTAPSAGLTTLNAYFAPVRGVTTGDAYGVFIEGSNILTGAGAAGPRSYVVGIEAYKSAGAQTVAGADDAALRINMNVRMAVGTVYTVRGLNCTCTIGNSSGSAPGTVAQVENMISVAVKSGSTAPIARALSLVVENYGTVADELGGIKVDLRNEGAAATKEYGIWLHNSNNSIAGSVDGAIRITDTGANTGWEALLDMEGVSGNIATEGSTAYPDKAGFIKVIMPSGAAAYINVYDGTPA